MAPNKNPDDIATIKKQLKDLQDKLDRANKVNSSLISGEREENLLFKWSAPTRLYIKREKQWYWTMLLLFLIGCLFLLYLHQYILILVVLSILFVLYVSSMVPPESTEHSITTLGIRTLGELYTWDMLKDFWISYKSGREILNIDTNLSSPARLLFLFSTQDKLNLIKILKDKIPYMQAPKSQGFVARSSDGLYIPLNDVEATLLSK